MSETIGSTLLNLQVAQALTGVEAVYVVQNGQDRRSTAAAVASLVEGPTGLFLPLVGGTITGNLVVEGTLTAVTLNVSSLVLTNLPTSDAGLATGQLFSNGGFLCVKV